MSDLRTLTIDMLQAGQTRPYGPSEYKYQLTFTTEGKHKWTPREEQVIELVRALHDWPIDVVLLHSTHEWWRPYFKEVREESPGVWFIHIYREYAD